MTPYQALELAAVMGMIADGLEKTQFSARYTEDTYGIGWVGCGIKEKDSMRHKGGELYFEGEKIRWKSGGTVWLHDLICFDVSVVITFNDGERYTEETYLYIPANEYPDFYKRTSAAIMLEDFFDEINKVFSRYQERVIV